jgi:hypothetical protein
VFFKWSIKYCCEGLVVQPVTSESFPNPADHVNSFWVKKVVSKGSSHNVHYPPYKELFRFEGPYFETFRLCKVQFTVNFCRLGVLSDTNTKFEKLFMEVILHSMGTQ